MRSGDLALTPQIAFNGTKATITAWAGAVVGMEAYATDTSEKGVFDGSVWRWSSISGGGGGTWGSITGTLSDQADLQGELDNKQPIDSILTSLSGLAVAAGDLIIGLTSSTLQRLGVGVDTSDAKYLKRGVGPSYLHEWAIPTTAEVASSTNKRYVTDANLVVIGNTSGMNTGDPATYTNTDTTARTYNASTWYDIGSAITISNYSGNFYNVLISVQYDGDAWHEYAGAGVYGAIIWKNGGTQNDVQIPLELHNGNDIFVNFRMKLGNGSRIPQVKFSSSVVVSSGGFVKVKLQKMMTG